MKRCLILIALTAAACVFAFAQIDTKKARGEKKVGVAKKRCFTSEAHALAEQKAKVWQRPDPGYDPVLGYSPTLGPRPGAPPVDANGFAKPIHCVANVDKSKGKGTTPKFYCSVPVVVDQKGDP